MFKKNKDKLTEDVVLGSSAQEIYENQIVKGFFKELRERSITAWLASEDTDIDGRERTRMFMKILEGFERCFHEAMETGKISASILDKLRKGEFENL